MIIALASPRIATSLDEGLEKVRSLISEASSRGAEVVCFPEAYLPGLRGVDIDVLPYDAAADERILRNVAEWSRTYGIATIMGIEKLTEAGRQIAAAVFDAQGELLGYQTKVQIAPSEDPYYVPGNSRQIFEVNGVKFGVAICHEGWRYPETVRWAAVRGAKIVFHPQHTGSDREGIRLTEWGDSRAPYYEKAMMCRSIENTIYFASVNYALKYQESATCLIDPSGQCQAYLPYGEEGVLVQTIDIEKATGLLAKRYAPERNAPPPAGVIASAPDFELRDKSGTGRMILAWQDSRRASSADRPFRSYNITLEFSNQINASAALPTDISQPIIRYFDELAAIEGDWSDARQFRDPDDQFSIRCDCYRGKARFDVSLGAEFDDPAWIVELCLRVKQSDLQAIACRLRAFFGVTKTD